MKGPSADYLRLGDNFSRYHEDPANVLLHFFSTPLGFIGAISLLRKATNSSSVAMSVVFFYLLSLLPIVPNGDFYGTAIFCAIIVLCARLLKLGTVAALSLIVLGYALQDLSHLGTGEATFQSTYSEGGHISFSASWFWDIVEHSYYLLPLCVHVALPLFTFPSWAKGLAAPMPFQMQQLHVWGWALTPLIVFVLGSYCLDSKNSFCFFPGTPYFYRVLRCNMERDGPKEESRQGDIKLLRDWAMSKSPPVNTSTHWWYGDLDKDAKDAFDRCSHSTQVYRMFRSLFSSQNYCIDVVEGMNEVYVTGPKRDSEGANSDNIFYTKHVDGPWGLIPFVSVYRCIVGMDRNMMTTTHFPLANLSVNACAGDVLAFDFNREVHFISTDSSKRDISDEFRVTLKLHYCVYPRLLAPVGWLMHWLNVKYNIVFRALFLKTIKPTNSLEHFLAWNVTVNTDLFNGLEQYFGQRNLLYLSLVGALWYATGCYEVFFALTSFVHYCRYISTFYIRKGVDFGSFKRDVLLFKTISISQLFFCYAFPQKNVFQLDLISIGMIVTGYILSLLATQALGIDRTYFAAELGLVEPKWITQFPYGYIPHPMIVSQIWALLGLYKAAHFRAEAPYVIPLHVTLYLVHMMQEHFEIYQRYPKEESSVPVNTLGAHDKEVMSKYH
eukprot:CAMPEP_0119042208 /NCGR_PEP_ID=MMETSP1177-20130426/14444_1 /TAXON_ID=2985 /ORGANISM="Ochromonas sp, Strain CCMP1899" /LENGTH=666 /DNA_ID=CAMNT_0007008827 /DNA_START=246 /DNA_END=2246 /DNA_ORIENTATION=-